MRTSQYGRKVFSFDEGDAELTSTVVTESALPGEDEETFTRRLLEKYPVQRGTIEVVFKLGRPDYAVITISDKADVGSED
jgi:hypothetical protein